MDSQIKISLYSDNFSFTILTLNIINCELVLTVKLTTTPTSTTTTQTTTGSKFFLSFKYQYDILGSFFKWSINITKSISVPICKCDDRGMKINHAKGNWCFLETSPCVRLTNEITPINWTWVRCNNHNGNPQVDCEGNIRAENLSQRIYFLL